MPDQNTKIAKDAVEGPLRGSMARPAPYSAPGVEIGVLKTGERRPKPKDTS